MAVEVAAAALLLSVGEWEAALDADGVGSADVHALGWILGWQGLAETYGKKECVPLWYAWDKPDTLPCKVQIQCSDPSLFLFFF